MSSDWTSVQITLWGQNTKTFNSAGPHREFVIDCLGAPPYDLQEDRGTRKGGKDGKLFNNIMTRGYVDLIVRRFRIDQGIWDHGDYTQLVRCLRARHLWMTAYQDARRHIVTTDDNGDDHDLWTTDVGLTILPWKCVVKWSKPEFDFNNDRWMSMAIQLIAEKPEIGVVIV